MSLRYKGAVISATPPTTTGGPSGTAPGSWTLQQQLQAQSAGTWPSQPNQYIEDVFSTYLYTGNSSTQTITNNIDLSTKGGLLWIKARNYAGTGQFFQDTARGANNFLDSTTTGANQNIPTANFSFLTAGFSQNNNFASLNESAYNYCSWTFREQPKFFDVVTYTGNGSNRTIAHNLGSVPGCIIVKRTDTTGAWQVYHRSLANTEYLVLNTTAAKATGTTRWNSTTPTSTEFSLGTDSTVNANGGTYVAYLFAHDAGGFGLTGTDNVISCGSYTGAGTTGQNISLGWEPQFLLIKSTSASPSNWMLIDVLRGAPVNPTGAAILAANSTDSESTFGTGYTVYPNASGFGFPAGLLNDNNLNQSGQTYIYIAIRRGPMKTPTSGTSVFSPNTTSGSTGTTVTTNFPVDLQITRNGARSATTSNIAVDRLRGVSTTTTDGGVFLGTTSTNGESSAVAFTRAWDNTGFQVTAQNSGVAQIYWNFRRAPGFFDEVCYTGTGSATTFNHNLGVAPELMIVKRRDGTAVDWAVWSQSIASSSILSINTTDPAYTSGGAFSSTAPTASVFTVGTAGTTNASGSNYVAYLFATVAGVSKVGSYSGTGASQVINCGFTGGARFVLIKRTDSTGDWYTYDTARGMTSSTDPYLLLNSTAAETTGTDYVETSSTGFTITSTAPAGINANGGTYIFLAIA